MEPNNHDPQQQEPQDLAETPAPPQAADALEALAKGQTIEADSTDENAGVELEEMALADGAAPTDQAEPFLPAEDVDEAVVQEAAESADQVARMIAQASTQPIRRTPGRYQHSHQHLAFRRFAIPLMAAMAVLMFLISLWAILLLSGTGILANASDPRTRRGAVLMLMCIPICAVMVLGCVVFWRDLASVRRSQKKEPSD